MERGTKPGSINRPSALVLAVSALLLVGASALLASTPQVNAPSRHRDITTTVFWVGESADESNAYIHNSSSTWIEDWVGAFGGIDDPKKRCDYLPCDFKPKENPFYFALPYNDLTGSCQAKPSQREVPWFTEPPKAGDSIVKNQWIKITMDGRTAYAQWEDAGPFGEDDTSYVFGNAEPKARAGLDISPATAAYLGLNGQGQTSWEFVDANSVPDGPWRRTVTTSPPDCAAAMQEQ